MNMQVSSPRSVVSSSNGCDWNRRSLQSPSIQSGCALPLSVNSCPREVLLTTDYGLTARTRRAFSLLEVMIACGIFFIAVFAILALVSNTLRNARILRHVQVDAGMAAAELFKTNMVFEGSETGDFGDAYPDYSWERTYTPAESNGLWQVDIKIMRRGVH